MPFGFCELLNELGSKAVNWSSSADEDDDDDDLSVVVQALRTFYDRYPRGGLFDDPPKAAKAREAWQQTTQALVDIATCLEIPVNDDVATVQSQMTAEAADTAALPDEERRDKTRRNNARWEIAKLLHIFLSDCEQCSFGGVPLDDQALQEVERHCGLALVIADHQGDDWNQPWVLSELGDAELAAARARRQSPDAFRRNEAACLQEARANAEEALELARQQGEEDDDELDFEILSICERLLGDIDWYTGDQEPAVQHYARAVHYAQCFEVWPGHQPDRYTWTFEREQRWRVSTPLLELADESGDDAVPRALCAQIAGFFGTDPGFAWEHLTKALREQQPHQAGAAVNALFAPYHLPPADDLEGRDEKSRNLVDDFRRDAANMIRATEQRHPEPGPPAQPGLSITRDLGLVRLRRAACAPLRVASAGCLPLGIGYMVRKAVPWPHPPVAGTPGWHAGRCTGLAGRDGPGYFPVAPFGLGCRAVTVRLLAGGGVDVPDRGVLGTAGLAPVLAAVGAGGGRPG